MKKLLPSLFVAASLLFSAGPAFSSQLNKIAAVVNGEMITMYDLQKAAGLQKSDYAAGEKAKAIDVGLRKTLDGMIMEKLILKEAARLKIEVKDSDVDQEITNMYTSRGLTKAQFEKKIAEDGLSLQTLRENYKNGLIRRKVMAMEVGRKVAVTDAEVRAYYEAHKDNLYDRRGLHMYLIVYHPQTPYVETARKLKNGQMSWFEASIRFSVLPSRNKGGDTGPISWGSLKKDWAERLEKMKPGEVSDLFQFDSRFKAQVRVARPGQKGVENPKLLTLEEASEQIKGILREPKAKARYEEYERQLKSKASIDIRI